MQYETVENLYFIIIIVCDLATGRERQLTTGKRAERTKHDFRPETNLPLCHWSSQLFDLCAPSTNDVPVLLLNQLMLFQREELKDLSVIN